MEQTSDPETDPWVLDVAFQINGKRIFMKWC